MGEDSFKGLVIGSITALLFVFLIFTFFIGVGDKYGKDTSALSNNYYDLSEINQSLSNVQSEAEIMRNVASSSGRSNGAFGLVEGFFDGVGAFFGLFFSMFGFIVNLFDLIVINTLNIIFANAILTGTIVAIIIIGGLFGLYRALKQGS